jgi:FtsP/CotA-like multicopper oxidase with cupredoxin domain
MSLAVGLIVAAASLPAQAGIFPQCPTRDPAPGSPIVYGSWFADANGDGVLRASDGEIINPVSPNQVCVHLTAGDGFNNMADGREQYIFGFANATGFMPDPMMGGTWDGVMMDYMEKAEFPAPTLTFREGDEVYLSLTNVGMINRPDLFDPHSVHWHGFPNASAIFDGVPDASIIINMGSTLTYYYQVVEAGTFMYHCHVEATEHMQMGMLGNLYVTPAQDGTSLGGFTRFAYNDGDGSTGYNVDYPIQISAFDPVFHELHIEVQPLPFADMDDKYPMLNGRGYPDTVNTGALDPDLHPRPESSPMPTLIEAAPGDRILLRISSLSTTSYHTLTVQGIPMLVVGKGSRKLGPVNDTSQYYLTNSITIGGGQAVDVILDTAGIPAGTYFFYTTNLDHLANETEDFGGMMTEIRIQAPL